MIYKLHTYSDGSTMLSADLEDLQVTAQPDGHDLISTEVLNIDHKEFTKLQQKQATHDLQFDTSTGKVNAILKPMTKPKNNKNSKVIDK